MPELRGKVSTTLWLSWLLQSVHTLRACSHPPEAISSHRKHCKRFKNHTGLYQRGCSQQMKIFHLLYLFWRGVLSPPYSPTITLGSTNIAPVYDRCSHTHSFACCIEIQLHLFICMYPGIQPHPLICIPSRDPIELLCRDESL